MRTVALLLALLGLPQLEANAQETDAPEGAVIEAVEMSGFSPYDLSPGLRKDLDSLVGVPLNSDRIRELASRIEGEQPEVVAATRAVTRPDGKARVIFLIGRISDDTDLVENINARYIVESVELGGAAADVSQQLRDDLQKLVGRRLDTEEADRLKEQLEDELPGRAVERRISRGTQAGRIRVVFDVIEAPWIRFVPMRSKLVYHSDLGWSGVLDVPMSGSRSRHRFTAGFVFGNKDDLIEEYSGFRLRFESRAIGTKRLGASLEFSRFNQSWEDTTRSALAANPAIPEAYRTRMTVEPTATFAFSPSARLNAGVSFTELESLDRSPESQTANAWVAGISVDHRWDQDRDVRQTAAGSYQIRAGAGELDSDLAYKRHLWQARYQYDRDQATVIGSFSAGYISGQAPVFERFSLGDSTTLRGWNKFDIAPTGGERMFHQSLEFRYSHVAVFFDSGSVWDRSTDSRVRYSTGFGIHGDNGFLTVGFPLNADDDGATFLMGIRF
jgi:outer membrane protein assembly factor BamA